MSYILLGSLSLLRFSLLCTIVPHRRSSKIFVSFKSFIWPPHEKPCFKNQRCKSDFVISSLLLSSSPLLCRAGIHMWWCWHSNQQLNCLRTVSEHRSSGWSAVHSHRDICSVSSQWGQQGLLQVSFLGLDLSAYFLTDVPGAPLPSSPAPEVDLWFCAHLNSCWMQEPRKDGAQWWMLQEV